MASSRPIDVLCIGNAIVDVLARAEEDFLLAQGMRKGTMALIDEARAQARAEAARAEAAANLASIAASTTRLSMRAIELKIGTIMNIVNWCT